MTPVTGSDLATNGQLRKVSRSVEVVSQRSENQPHDGEGKTERLIETTGVSQEALKTSVSLRNLDVILTGICLFLIDRFSGQMKPLSSGA